MFLPHYNGSGEANKCGWEAAGGYALTEKRCKGRFGAYCGFMPEVIEPPAKPSSPYNITPANARELALRSHAARRAAKDLISTGKQIASDVLNHAANPHARKIERLESQLEQLDDLLDAAKTSADWRDLTNARTRLFEQWRVLSGIPVPGSRRPGREPGPKRAATWAQPVTEDPPAPQEPHPA